MSYKGSQHGTASGSGTMGGSLKKNNRLAKLPGGKEHRSHSHDK